MELTGKPYVLRTYSSASSLPARMGTTSTNLVGCGWVWIGVKGCGGRSLACGGGGGGCRPPWPVEEALHKRARWGVPRALREWDVGPPGRICRPKRLDRNRLLPGLCGGVEAHPDHTHTCGDLCGSVVPWITCIGPPTAAVAARNHVGLDLSPPLESHPDPPRP